MRRVSPMIGKTVEAELDKLPTYEQKKLWFYGIHLSCKITQSDIQGEQCVRLNKQQAREIRDLLLEQKEQ